MKQPLTLGLKCLDKSISAFLFFSEKSVKKLASVLHFLPSVFTGLTFGFVLESSLMFLCSVLVKLF